MNNFCEANSYYTDFLAAGAVDIIEKARVRQGNIKKMTPAQTVDRDTDKHCQKPVLEDLCSDNIYPEEVHNMTEARDENDVYKDMDRKNLDLFIPATRILSDITEDRIQEARQSVYTPMDVRVDIIKTKNIDLPNNLSVVAFPTGDVSMLPDPKVDRLHGHLCN